MQIQMFLDNEIKHICKTPNTITDRFEITNTPKAEFNFYQHETIQNICPVLPNGKNPNAFDCYI
jgi:hypothetical protein